MRDVILEVTGTATEDRAQPVVMPRRPGDPPAVVAAADVLRDARGGPRNSGCTTRSSFALAWTR
jgi:UDP-glucose 4-epimerase